MIDRSHAGFRCRVIKLIRTVSGNLLPGFEGTVQYEMSNLGRDLILINSDLGFDVMVFPEEIALLPMLGQETLVENDDSHPAVHPT